MSDKDDQLSSLSGAVIFTMLNLANGFLQIPLSEEAKKKTAFVTEDESAQFQRTPIGLRGALREFQRFMNILFRELKETGVVR